MKSIESKPHGYLDYIVGALLIAAPWLFGFYQGGIESWVPIAMGVFAILYSLLTNYELGVVKVIPFKTHLVLDVLGGLFLAVSPVLFGFTDRVVIPHIAIGIVEIVVAAMTNTTAYAQHHHKTTTVRSSVTA